ncbi:carbohydrate kinase family protein [bacterium]|nr:carbohydrate kinase family protein [bacterium]
MNQIICVGSSGKDIFLPTDEGIILDTPEDITSQKKFAFELGAKYQIDDRFEALGGCAANVSAGLARLGIKVYCCTKIGDDMLGEWIKAELEKEKVSTDLIQTEKSCKSDLSAIIVSAKSGERTIFFNRDANEKLEIFPEKLKNTDWIFVSALNGEWEKNLDAIINLVKKENIKLAFNPGQRNIKDNPGKIIEAIKNCNLLLLNKDEAIEIVNSEQGTANNKQLNDEVFLIKRLRELRPEIVVITDGLRGAWAFDGKNLFYVQSTEDKPIDTTGAGDAFSSAFLASYLKGKKIEESLKWGAANGGSAVKFYGAIEGLLNIESMEKYANDIEVKRIVSHENC